MNNICNFDNECTNDNLCSFNDKDLKHYCVDGKQNKLYLGCLDNDYKNFENIVSNSENDTNSFKSCIDFSRRQVNKDGLNHNLMLFKQKKVSYVDITSIRIYLKCGNKIISALPLNDYFTMDCDLNNQNCKIKTNKLFKNFVTQNQDICSQQLFLEVNYECYNENIKNKDIILVNELEDELIINMKCPVNQNKDDFQSKCISMYINKNDLDKMNQINKKKLLYNCPKPIYDIPRLIKDTTTYKKMKFKNNNNEINSFDENINAKLKELNELQAKKFIKIKKINEGEDIPLKVALESINKFKFNDISNVNKKWQLFKDYDAGQYLMDDPLTKDAVKLYGKVYTIEEAMNIASKMNESFFVYYSNSYGLNNFSSNLYFIDVFTISNDIFDKKNWAKSENVTTGILNFENFYDDPVLDPNIAAKQKADEIDKFLRKELEYREILSNEFINLTGNKLKQLNEIEAPVINSMVSNLDSKITTKNQAINMNNTEEKMNNGIINTLSTVLFIIFVIFIFLLAYYNSSSSMTTTP